MEAMLTPRRGTKILNPQAALNPIPIMNPRKVSTFNSLSGMMKLKSRRGEYGQVAII
jgi:hypothetical protein